MLSFPTPYFRLPQDSGRSLVAGPEQPARPRLELQHGDHGTSYSIETDSSKITRKKGGGSLFEAGLGLPQELDLPATRRNALLARDKVDRSDPSALRVIGTFERLRYDDRAAIEGTFPIEAASPGIHLVEWRIVADELARPITGRLMVEARPVAESGEPVRDLGARPPGDAAARRLRSKDSLRAA